MYLCLNLVSVLHFHSAHVPTGCKPVFLHTVSSWWTIKFIKTNTGLRFSSSLILWCQCGMFAVGDRTSSQTFALIIKHIMSTLGYWASRVHVNVPPEAMKSNGNLPLQWAIITFFLVKVMTQCCGFFPFAPVYNSSGLHGDL